MGEIEILQGDITQAKVDAIVNAANPQMLGGGGVDGAIHTAAGPDLLAACKKIKAINGIRCPFGEARITPAGNLRAKFVIHTAGPIYRQKKDPASILKASYRDCLRLAIENHCESIAFPAISCGVYGYPLDSASEISIGVCLETEFSALKISHYLFSTELRDLWLSAYQNAL